MLPKSYDKVSEETKRAVQLSIARASGFLQGKKGQSDEKVRTAMDDIEKEAIKEAVKIAVEVWKKHHQPCTAERFVQQFADLVGEAATGNHDRHRPYEFKAAVHEGPLSTEFLEAIGLNEQEARASPQVKKEQSPESEWSIDQQRGSGKQQSPSEETTLPLQVYPEEAREEPATLKSEILNTLEEESLCESRKKRKNGDPETTAPKRRRWDDGQWSGIPLADYEFRLMNAGLMEAIWETRIYNGDNVYYDAGVFSVKIPKDKAWPLLGEDISMVFKLIPRLWYPLRLYTCDLGNSLQVGLWVEQSRSQGQMEEEVYCKSVELYHILRYWAFQAECGEMQSLATILQDYLKHLRAL